MSDKTVLISYIPYLRRKAEHCGQLVTDLEEIKEVLGNEPFNVSASGCIWVLDDDGKPGAILCLKDSTRLVEDMKTWAENQPRTFFRVIVSKHEDKYGVVIVPDLEMSVTRFRLSHQAITGNKLDLKHVSLFFTAVGFVSKSGTTTYDKIKDQIGKELSIYFLDVDEDSFDPSMLKKSISFGKLKLEDTSYQGHYFSQYCNSSAG